MVTTPRLALEVKGACGFRQLGLILIPAKSPETLPPVKGDKKLVDKEAAGVLLLFEDRVRGRVTGNKCEQEMVVTAIAHCVMEEIMCVEEIKNSAAWVLIFGSGLN